jgi:acyl-coenzyme A synthetase/AMP-(fatty) acid ligase
MGPIVNESIYESVAGHARRDPGRVALDGDRPVKAAELLARSDTLAAYLLDAPARVAVGYIGDDPRDFLTALLACSKAGAVLFVGLSDPRVLRQAAKDCPGLLLLHAGNAAMPESLLAARWTDLREIERGTVVRPLVAASAPDEVRYVLYTSGTTGAPIGVMATEASFLINADDMIRSLPFDRCGTFVVHAPLDVSYGLSLGAVLPLLLGIPIRVVRPGHPRRTLRAVAGCESAVVVASPVVYREFLDHSEVLSAAARRAGLRWFSSGDALPDALRARLEEKGVRLCDCYGSTETNGIAIADGGSEVGFHRLPSVFTRLAAGENGPGDPGGELLVRGPKVMRGYFGHGAEGATRDRLRDGWVRTLDWAEAEGDDRFRLRGRLSTMIKVGGRRVHAEEVERAIEALPKVKRAVVFGSPDALHGEVVAAYVQPDGGEAPSPDELRRGLADALPPYMRPRQIAMVDDLSTARGKKPRAFREPGTPRG